MFQDELELPDGKVRIKVGGGIAGHNGLRSISAHIGNEYRRVPIGIGHPGVKELVHGHVLSDFAKSDRPWVEALCEAMAENAGLLVTEKNSTFQNRVHLALQAKGFSKTRKLAAHSRIDRHREDDTRVKPAYDNLKSIHALLGLRARTEPWDSNAALSGCRMSANRRCSMR